MSKEDTSIIPSVDDELETLPKSELLAENPLLDSFLNKWDRQLSEDRRVYGIKLLLSGSMDGPLRSGLYRIGIRHIKLSYYDFRVGLSKRSIQDVIEDVGRFDFVLIDPGIEQFISAKEKKNRHKRMTVQSYADEYYNEMQRIGRIFSGCIEARHKDLSEDYVEKKRKFCLENKIPLVPVLFGESIDALEETGIFEKFCYLAVSSDAYASDTGSAYLQELWKLGREKGIIFHGLGTSSVKTIQRDRYYSVDSSYWKSGTKFGQTMVFLSGKIKVFSKDEKNVRKKYRSRFESEGLIQKDIENEKPLEVDLMNALAWRQWAEYVKFSSSKCYWLSFEEKTTAINLRAKAFTPEGLIDRKKSLARAEYRRLSQITDAGYDDRAHESLFCDQCFIAGKCPRFRSGSSCGFDINVRMETKADLQRALQIIVETQFGRVMTGVLFEKVEGGVIDPTVSKEMKEFVNMIKNIQDIFDSREEITIKAKGAQGAVANMLASVFTPTKGTPTIEAAANRIREQDAMDKDEDIIDVEVEEEPNVVPEDSYDT